MVDPHYSQILYLLICDLAKIDLQPQDQNSLHFTSHSRTGAEQEKSELPSWHFPR